MYRDISQNGRNGRGPARKNPKWTVMVYLAGDNNLTPNCITVLQQLEAVKDKDDIRVLACFDSNTPWPKGSRYLVINGKRSMNDDNLDWEIYNDLVITEERDHHITAPDFCEKPNAKGHSMKRTDVAEGLKRFLRWAMKEAGKSEHYMLVLYGHGPVVAGKTFLARENPLSSLRMQDLPEILGRHFGPRRRLDILACQNCVMNGIETAHEVRNLVNYMIGSQGLVLAYGWPYEKIIRALADNLDDSPSDITRKILKACARHLIDFSVMDRSSEQSVCDLSKLRSGGRITQAIRELGEELAFALEFIPVQGKRKLADPDQKVVRMPVVCDAVRLARLEAQSYWGESFVDIYDFCERLLKKCNEAVLVHNDLISSLGVNGALEHQLRDSELMKKLRAIINCCRNVMETVEQMVPHTYYIGSELQYSHGVSIYFPWSMQREPYTFFYRRKEREHVLVTAFETYSQYDFVKDSGWADFLRVFYKATLRKVRRADRAFSMLEVNADLSNGMVREEYKTPTEVLKSEQMQKTDSNTGAVDCEVWSYVKNYPRRNYLSPSDCPRRPKPKDRTAAAAENPNSPAVSYLGWNLCKFVADVIARKPETTDTKVKPAPEVVREKLARHAGRRS
jgi:cysteine peptidase C11 family protein